MGFFSWLFGKEKKTVPPPFPSAWENELIARVHFYRHLETAQRRQFRERMMEFLATTTITGVKTEITDEDRMLLAAGAIIPIFAFPEWKYHNLREILVYPEHFDEDFTIGSHKKAILGMVGEGFMNDQMIISKKALHHGFSNDTDKRNTAIHEFIHLMDKSDGTVDGLPVHFIHKTEALPWIDLMEKNIRKIKADRSDIDDYGATNPGEFLAVAGEYFFERPALLQKKHPELFEMLQTIFNRPFPEK